jgi:hypothetical protein
VSIFEDVRSTVQRAGVNPIDYTGAISRAQDLAADAETQRQRVESEVARMEAEGGGATVPAPPAVNSWSPAPSVATVSGGQCQIGVRNDFPVTQHVFIDGALRGTVGTGQSRSFNVSPGSHEVLCADSANVADNPVRERCSVAQGEVYEMRVYGH